MSLDITYILIVLIVILFSMTFHEAMHAYSSYWLGDDTAKDSGRLTLNPVKHLDPFLSIILPLILAITGAPVFGGAKPVPFSPDNLRFGEWGVAIVALAGPISNFFIAFVSFGIWALLGYPLGLAGQVFGITISVNLGFFIFNMIPIPPLDGSRFLYVLAPDFFRKGMDYLEQFGVLLVFIILIFFGSYIDVLMSNSLNFFFDLFQTIFK